MSRDLKSMIFAAVFTALTAIGAFIQIPIPPYPVPMTLQTAFIFLAGLLLAPRAAFFSQLTYLVLGLVGIPIFTKGGGIAYIFDPTFGYLLAFLFCAPAISLLARKYLYRGKKAHFIAGALLIVFAVQLCGVFYMTLIAQVDIGFSYALYLIFIFIPLDAFKLIMMTLLSLELVKRLPFIFGETAVKSA